MSTPISIKKILRKAFLARSKSDETFDLAVRNSVEDFDSSIYGEIGDSVGATILGFNADTQGLDIEERSMGHLYSVDGVTFSLGPAKPYRYDTEHKITPALKQVIQSSYEDLNSYMIRCMPNEYPEDSPQAVLRDPTTGQSLSPHDFRFTGDVSTVFSIARVKNVVMSILRSLLGDNIAFVEYISPVKANDVVENKVSEVSIEGYTMHIDEKGNKIIPNDTVIEDKVLS